MLSEYKVISGRKILPHHFIAISRLDEQIFESKYRIGIIKGIKWIIKGYPGYTIVIDKKSKKVIAYTSIVSLKEKYYNLIKQGEMIDATLPIRGQRFFSKKVCHHLYCSSVVIKEGYQSTSAIIALVNGVLMNLTALAKKGVFGDKILADAVTESGIKLCSAFGFEKVQDSSHGSTIYETTLIPMEMKMSMKCGDELKKIYSEKFEKKEGTK